MNWDLTVWSRERKEESKIKRNRMNDNCITLTVLQDRTFNIAQIFDNQIFVDGNMMVSGNTHPINI